MIHDKFAALRRVLTHVELEQRLDRVGVIHRHRSEPHLRTYKIAEFAGRDFAEAFEPSDFGVADLGHRAVPLGFGITIDRFLFVPYSEQWGFQDVHKTSSDYLREKAQKTGDEQVTDMQ